MSNLSPLPTVRVKSESGSVIINESDFDPSVHIKVDETGKPVSDAKPARAENARKHPKLETGAELGPELEDMDDDGSHG